MILMLLTFSLVSSINTQSYGTAVDVRWDKREKLSTQNRIFSNWADGELNADPPSTSHNRDFEVVTHAQLAIDPPDRKTNFRTWIRVPKRRLDPSADQRPRSGALPHPCTTSVRLAESFILPPFHTAETKWCPQSGEGKGLTKHKQ
jgi:hypothetical protein